jgi:hypothetical protein
VQSDQHFVSITHDNHLGPPPQPTSGAANRA